MNNVTRVILGLLCVCGVTATSGQPAGNPSAKGQRPTVAVMEFTGSFRQFSKEEFSAVTSRFETELMNSGKFEVLERRNMDAILQEQGFQQSGACDNSECQVKVGQLLGVERLIGGEISKVGDIVTMNVKMIDVGTGSNLKSHALDIQGDMQTVLRGGCFEMAQILAGLKQPNGERTVLTAEKSSPWPWILGGAALVSTGVVTWILLSQDDGPKDRVVDTGF